ncbi:hypothetical protein [Mycolicibacterium vinylchloridicum]|uniref:hypothetical protein n=1 Tax=Mycolicibacterium vinylchloridicum TaxID=2736928 RepID=UPI00022E3D6E|nr:hypothetical protein [Mycolicibacterium vinylchloridicum]EHB46430.1 hypothetical protein MycrhDRAFT_6234 [Mycolicibacterium rhodesiae JS60]
MTIACDPDKVVGVINELHDVAETVRTYGDLGQAPSAQRPAIGAMPTQLYLLAAAVEAQMRSLIHIDRVCASRLWPPPDAARKVMHFELTAADTVVVSAVSTEICVAELGQAHRRLTGATKQLRTALQSPSIATVFESLDKEVERLRVFVAAFA